MESQAYCTVVVCKYRSWHFYFTRALIEIIGDGLSFKREEFNRPLDLLTKLDIDCLNNITQFTHSHQLMKLCNLFDSYSSPGSLSFTSISSINNVEVIKSMQNPKWIKWRPLKINHPFVLW